LGSRSPEENNSIDAVAGQDLATLSAMMGRIGGPFKGADQQPCPVPHDAGRAIAGHGPIRPLVLESWSEPMFCGRARRPIGGSNQIPRGPFALSLPTLASGPIRAEITAEVHLSHPAG